MQFTDEQRRQLEEQIAAYEAKRDDLLAQANLAQGAAMALHALLQTKPKESVNGPTN